MKIEELSKIFMNSQILKCELNFSFDLDESKNIKITVRQKDQILQVNFINPHEIDIIENEFHQYYIEDLKVVKLKENLLAISLDPVDGRIGNLVEEDNFVIKFEKFKVEILETDK